MKHLSTFEGWRDSEKLNKLNRLTGIFDTGPICEIENGDDYGLRDEVVKAHVIKCNDTTIHFEKITGEMDDDFNDLIFHMSDGKKISLKSKWITGPTDPSKSRHKEFFILECDNEIFKIDPQWVLDDVISEFGDGSHLLFAILFYPNCEMYYKEEKVNIPNFKMV